MAITVSPVLPAWPSLGIRLLAMVYEVFTAGAVLFFGFLLPQAVIGSVFNGILAERLLLAHVFLLLAIYFVWQWRKGGQTLAMRTWRILLQNADGSPLGLSQGLLRYTLAWPGILVLGIGLWWALFDKEKQFLHDRLAGTRLIRLPKANTSGRTDTPEESA